MHNISDIQKAVSQLKDNDLSKFREWFDEFDAVIWDKQFEADVKSGKLDKLARQAISDVKAGNFKKL